MSSERTPCRAARVIRVFGAIAQAGCALIIGVCITAAVRGWTSLDGVTGILMYTGMYMLGVGGCVAAQARGWMR